MARGSIFARVIFGSVILAFATVTARATPVPTGLTATPSGYTVNLNWTYVANTSWVIERRTNTSSYQYLSQVYTNSYTDFNLANGTQYYYAIYAYTNSVASAWTPDVSAIISVTVPTPQVTATLASAYQINVSWTTSATAWSWQAQRSVNGGAYSSLGTFYSPSLVDTSVSNNTTYSYQVRTQDNNGNWSAWSTPATQTISVTVPAPQVTATMVSAYQINVSWTNSASAWSWQAQRSVNGGAYSSLGSFYSPSLVDTSVFNNTTYSYQVRMQDSNGTWSAWSAPATQTMLVTVPAPSGLSAVASSGQVRLSWSAVSSAYNYQVYRAAALNGSYSNLGTVYSTSYVDSSITPGITYFYKVCAVDAMRTVGTFAGPVSAGDMTNAPLNNGLPESPHPYPNNLNQTWAYQGPNDAAALNLTFDPRTLTEGGYDFITIMDGAGNVAAGPFSGSALAGRTVQVNGNVARISLTSDYSNNAWGFALTSITPILPPPPPAPVALAPAAGAVVSGSAALSWVPRSGAQSYQVEWSSNGITWSTIQTAGTFYAPNLNNGPWQWRVRSVNSAGLSSPSPATAFTLTSGYALSYTLGAASPDSLRYQVSFTPYRAPAAAALSVSGLPPSVRWSFNPPTVSGTSSSVLELDGVTSLASQGAVNFNVMAGTVPVDGGLITLAVTGSLAFTDTHAYPNPARGQIVHLRLSLTLPPTSLKLRIYDLSGARVLDVSESAPFSAFTTLDAMDYEYVWDGANASGRGVASDKYIYWVEAVNGNTTVTTRGLFTFMRR